MMYLMDDIVQRKREFDGGRCSKKMGEAGRYKSWEKLTENRNDIDSGQQ